MHCAWSGVAGAARAVERGVRAVRTDKVLRERFSEEVELTQGFERWVRVAQIGRWEGHSRQKELLVETLKQGCVIRCVGYAGEVARGEAGEKDVEGTSDQGGHLGLLQ